MKKKLLITLSAIAGVLLAFMFFYSSFSSADGEYDEFAKCLTENDVKMYGTEWCSHCQNQKKMFGNSFEYVDFVDCDKSRSECIAAGIRGYPTWKIEGQDYPGTRQLSELSTISGCPL